MIHDPSFVKQLQEQQQLPSSSHYHENNNNYINDPNNRKQQQQQRHPKRRVKRNNNNNRRGTAGNNNGDVAGKNGSKESLTNISTGMIINDNNNMIRNNICFGVHVSSYAIEIFLNISALTRCTTCTV